MRLSDGYTVLHPPAVAPGASPRSIRFSMRTFAADVRIHRGDERFLGALEGACRLATRTSGGAQIRW